MRIIGFSLLVAKMVVISWRVYDEDVTETKSTHHILFLNSTTRYIQNWEKLGLVLEISDLDGHRIGTKRRDLMHSNSDLTIYLQVSLKTLGLHCNRRIREGK